MALCAGELAYNLATLNKCDKNITKELELPIIIKVAGIDYFFTHVNSLVYHLICSSERHGLKFRM